MLLSKRLMTVKSCPRKAGCVKNQAQSLIIKAALNTKEVDSWLHQDPNQKPSSLFFKPSCAAPLAKKNMRSCISIVEMVKLKNQRNM